MQLSGSSGCTHVRAKKGSLPVSSGCEEVCCAGIGVLQDGGGSSRLSPRRCIEELDLARPQLARSMRLVDDRRMINVSRMASPGWATCAHARACPETGSFAEVMVLSCLLKVGT